MEVTEERQEEDGDEEAADTTEGLKRPDEGEFLLGEGVGDVEDIHDHEAHYEYADVEEDDVGGQVEFADPLGHLEEVQEGLHVMEHAFAFPREVQLG